MIGPESDHGQRRGQGATPAAFYLGLCRLRGILSPPASATVFLQAGNSSLPTTILAVILNSGPEITNRCTLEGVSVENPASILKSGLEIKNRCTLEGVSGENLASIPKSELEFKNRCSRCLVAVCRRNHSSSRLRRLESNADLVAATAVAGETVLLRGNEN